MQNRGFIVGSSGVGYDGSQYVRDEEHQVYQEQKPRERSFVRELVPDWRPTRAQVQSAIRIVVVVAGVLLLVLLVLYLIGRRFDITLLNLLKVLAVPITVGAAVPLLNWLQKKRELDVENQRAQDEALQAYLEQTGQLLLDKHRPLRRAGPGDNLSTVVRAQTLSVLVGCHPDRKRILLLFLYESGLIDRRKPVLDLRGADLNGADLSQADLRWADLSRAYLRGADLSGAVLSEANLSRAYLSQAVLRTADLRGADLSGADLSEANLRWADLRGADLSGARLDKAYIVGATMPNGQKYEDWLKSKGGGEDRENGNSS